MANTGKCTCEIELYASRFDEDVCCTPNEKRKQRWGL